MGVECCSYGVGRDITSMHSCKYWAAQPIALPLLRLLSTSQIAASTTNDESINENSSSYMRLCISTTRYRGLGIGIMKWSSRLPSIASVQIEQMLKSGGGCRSKPD